MCPQTMSDAGPLCLASLARRGLSIFGGGIANGLIAGGPQLGTGAAVGAGLAVAGVGAAAAALTAGGVGAAGGAIGGAARAGAGVAGGTTTPLRARRMGGVPGPAGSAAHSPPLPRAPDP